MDDEQVPKKIVNSV